MGTSRREYEETHPWLVFRIDLKRADPDFWLLLGEARSKIQHVAGALLKPEIAESLHSVYMAKGIHATTAIEGNTLTEEQARQVIEGTLKLPSSQQYLAVEVQNVCDVCNAIRDNLLDGGPRELTRETILDYNRQVLAGLELEEGVVPGQVRTHPVVVSRYRGAPAEDCDHLLDRLCEWLNEGFEPPSDEWRLPYALLKAVAAHLYLAWIHPFGDGNGRTARLLELQILLAAGVPTPACHLFSNHYNQTRAEYQRQLDASSNRPGEDQLPFMKYGVQGFVEGLREQLALIREQQFDDRWEQYIYERFGETTSAAEVRRRQLMLDLSTAKRLVRRNEIRSLSPALAEAYASKTSKTISRDINALVDMGLLAWQRPWIDEDRQYHRGGFVPRREIIEAFLPISAPVDVEDSLALQTL